MTDAKAKRERDCLGCGKPVTTPNSVVLCGHCKGLVDGVPSDAAARQLISAIREDGEPGRLGDLANLAADVVERLLSRRTDPCELCFGAGFVWQRKPHEGDEYEVPCPRCSQLVVPPWLFDLRQQLRTQDNAATADPMFVVQQRVREYGYDPHWVDNVTWVREGDELEEEEAAACEATYDETGSDRLNEANRTGYKDRWEFVTACLTRYAAESYIQRMRHRLCEPRVFVESGYRNHEWIRLRAWLMGEERWR